MPEPEYLDVKSGEAVEIGEALVLSSGVLTKCGAAVAPEYIAMGAVTKDAAKREIAACRVERNQVFEVPVTAAPTSLKPGAKVTLHTDAMQVTATTTDGVVTVVALNGATKAGDLITVRI